MNDRRSRLLTQWEQLQELMAKTGPCPADYTDRMQRLAAMLNQALCDRPIKDNHPEKAQEKP